MLSILIPTYNYEVSELVYEVHKQATNANIDFEIICFDDFSSKHVIENQSAIDALKHSRILISDKNLGRIKSRARLSNESKYDWLLFLDADVLPKSGKFIKNYIDKINKDHDAIYGGFAYQDMKPDSNYVLRWAYGRKNEEISSTVRNKKPYKITISANFLIRKTTFNQINSKINYKGYGYDNYFASLLKLNNVNVLHIENEVYHLGIEKSNTFLLKTEEATKTLLRLYKSKEISVYSNSLLNSFVTIKKLRLNYLFSFAYVLFKNMLKKHLLSAFPSIFLFQLYKIGYMCHVDLN